MPEGDSIAKVAAQLRPRLVGQTLQALSLRHQGPVPVLVGQRVREIQTRGKHMLIRITPGYTLHVHLGMNGRWRWFPASRRRPGEAFGSASIAVVTEQWVVLCTRAARAELRRDDDPQLQRTLARLGPDLMDPQVDPSEVAKRARACSEGSRPVAEVLLDQRIAAGIGNVFKSEILFIGGVHPMTPLQRIEDARLAELFATASSLLRANLTPGGRTTTTLRATGIRRPPSVSRYFVYRRRGLPCFRCGTPIERALLGDLARSTYWCPVCQPAQ